MTFQAVEGKYEDFYVPRFQIDMGGEKITDADGLVSRLSVNTTVEGADHFSFTLVDTFDSERREFEELDLRRLEAKPRVEIAMGYSDALEPMFVGRIEAAEPSFPTGGVPMVEVSGYGRLYELMTETRSETWDSSRAEDQVTDSAVVSKVIERGNYGFDDITIDDTDLVFPRIVQDNQTDYQFLVGRARRYSYEVFSRREDFFFGAPRDDRPPVLELGYGESLLSFSPQFNRADDVSEVVVRWSDRKGRTDIVGRADGVDPSRESSVIRVPVESKAEATRVAQAEVDRIRQSRIRGSGETIGIPEIVAGTTIELSGLTERFDGLYYVESAEHSLSTDGYTTSFQVRLGNGGQG